MPHTIYALLIGIDNYPSPVATLKGCVNDVIAVEEYLNAWVEEDSFQLRIHILKNQEATRQAIIDGFRHHLCQAGINDVALFYYSGHGSQEQAPPEFWHLEPDRLNETLVCWDSRTEGSWDLADKELAKLIAEVAAKNPHITVILDCCHSGSGTRDPLLETGIRRIPADKRPRPLNSFIVSLDEVEQLSNTARSPVNNPTGWNLPKGRHILLAACRDSEEAKEYYGNGQSRGVFCFFLMETLKRVNGRLTYRDLFKRTNALVRSRVTAQSPQLEVTEIKDLDQPFLGGAISERSIPYFTVSYQNDFGWVIDGGAVHGIPSNIGDETTKLALFSFDSPPEQLRQISSSVGSAEVIQVLPQLSKVHFNGLTTSNTDITFKAVITNLPMPPLGVRLEGDMEGIQRVRQAILESEPGNNPSLYVREATESARIEFRVLAQSKQYLITRPADDRPLVSQIQNYTPETATLVVRRLEHIARWTAIAELANFANSRIQQDAIRMELYQGDKVLEDTQIRLEYTQDSNGNWNAPSFLLKLTNTSSTPLYCVLLDLTDRYAIQSNFFEAGGVWLNIGEEAWALGRKPLHAEVPVDLWEQGITECKDILKLIISTAEFDARLLTQQKLDIPQSYDVGTTRSINQKSILNRLINRAQTRDIGGYPETEELYEDWITSQISITTVRPLNTTPVPRQGNGISLGAGVVLQPHLGLQASARLTTVTQSTRDLGNLILPSILREDPVVIQPFHFTTSRGTDPGLSVLELNNINAETIQTVTSQEPLILTVDQPLGEGERILAIAYDGEFFLPLGTGQSRNGEISIRLERLPETISEGRRSLSGSIRIFFQKVVAEKLGLEFTYPLLAIAEVDDDYVIRYEADPTKVKERIAQANRIVLYIHGIIGDTQSITPSVKQAKVEIDGQSTAIADLYNLVLCFDYENINTSIEQNARLLKQRLETVGLGANHGKILHIIAHSMGGLVSRWFIEREGGNQCVSHLIMLGTPNAGSPWPTVQAWATAALGIGLNSFSTVAWPVKVLGSLVAAIEAIDITLDQMQPDSEFLKSLAASPDPMTPYTILAGNISIMTAVMEEDRLKRLMQKLFNWTVALPFFGQPNDIAATVHSIKSIGEGRLPKPIVQEVGCDHLVYFSHEMGLKALAGAISQAQSLETQPILSVQTAPASAAHNNQQNIQENSSQKIQKPKLLTGFIIGILAALTAIVGVWIWQQSTKPQPDNQNKTSQSLSSHQSKAE